MTRQLLIDMAHYNHGHATAGTLPQVQNIMEVPASHYTCPERWALEMRQVFRRLPLMLAVSAELREPGDYKTLNVAGVPVLLVRHPDGDVRAFFNSCSHRGAQIMTEPRGNARQFSCPYHAWTYNHGGDLIAVYGEKDFGAVDKACNGLKALPVLEKAGLIWAILDPDSNLAIEDFLSGYDGLLEHFGFADWHLFDFRTLRGPNWKIAYDGYMDFYHLPILHRDTFGPNMSSQAFYTAWGPHQRVSSPDRGLAELKDVPEAEWEDRYLLGGVWTIFPHVSIANFDGGGRGVMVSQLFPGSEPGESFTNQLYLMENEPTDDDTRQQAHDQFAFLEHVVRDEDYATGLRQQAALDSGLRNTVMFGRNEGGGQHFHRFLDTLLKTDDADLPALFSATTRPVIHGEPEDALRS